MVDFQLNLASETVAQAHPEEPLIVAPSVSLRDVLQLMQSRNRGSVMVCSAGATLEGIFTERDVVSLMAGDVDLDVPIEQVICHFLDCLADTGLDILPLCAAQAGWFRFPAVGTDVPGDAVGLVDRDKQLVTFSKFQAQVLAVDVVDDALHQPGVLPNTMVDMHNPIVNI